VWTFLSAINLMANPFDDKPRPYIIAHRGSMDRCPENTIAAFRRALSDGADVIETDVRLSADGAVVCLHDATVDRTTDGSGPVDRLSLQEIRRLDASGGKADYRGERIPTLLEVARLIPEDRALAVELKGNSFLREEAHRALLSVLEEAGIARRTLVLSFQVRHLATLQPMAPELALGLVSLRHVVPPAGPAFLGTVPSLLRLNPWYVKVAHRRGQLVCPLDPRPDPNLRRYLRMGCDAILTNDPGTTIESLRRLGNRH
jgi:glycerophosphoryl diester phosphodiesterase